MKHKKNIDTTATRSHPEDSWVRPLQSAEVSLLWVQSDVLEQPAALVLLRVRLESHM